jgi:MOSC domain-containing protein
VGAGDGAIRLSRIEIFPIKSLDGLCLDACAIDGGGILENDRVYAIFDADGLVVNGKRTPRVHALRCAYSSSGSEVTVWEDGQGSRTCFNLMERGPLERWLTDFFGFAVHLRYEPRRGFPDDPEAYGPTVVGEASLRAVQTWYPEVPLASIRRRFRTNLELAGGEAFWEDALFSGPDERKPFRVGAVGFLGHNPCQRCVVPTRDPETGQVIQGFQKSFARRREQHLPPWADRRRFNHFYRFAVNTSIPAAEVGKRLRVGDALFEA